MNKSTEKPILFNTIMVCAILEGRKTQTRHIVNGDGPKYNASDRKIVDGDKPKYGIGDVIWVKERFVYQNNKTSIIYEAGYDANERAAIGALYGGWKPSSHMPRWACRIELKVTGVRKEPLQDINGSESDALAEGVIFNPQANIDARCAFRDLWETIHGVWSFDRNPLVWVYEFERVR